MLNIGSDEPVAIAVVEAIRNGDLEALQRLLSGNPGLAAARIGNTRTLLHVAADWPGHFPNGAATVAALIAHGAVKAISYQLSATAVLLTAES